MIRKEVKLKLVKEKEEELAYDDSNPSFGKDGDFKAKNAIQNIFCLKRVKEIYKKDKHFLDSKTFKRFYDKIKKDIYDMVDEPEYFIDFIISFSNKMILQVQEKDSQAKIMLSRLKISFDLNKKQKKVVFPPKKLNDFEKKRLKKKQEKDLEETLNYLTINPSALCKKQMKTIENIIVGYKDQAKEYTKILS